MIWNKNIFKEEDIKCSVRRKLNNPENFTEPLVFEPITVESLQQDKGFLKTSKKQQKDLEAMRKRHAKEKMLLQKQQCAAIEKMIKGKNKEQLTNDTTFRTLVTDQSNTWSELVSRHRREECAAARTRLDDQRELLKKMMEQTQLAQMKQLEAKHERELKEMNTRQAKISVETSKEVANDKTLKTKQEKDRRLREKKQNNIKKFMDEKKTQTIKQNREKEKLKVTHDKQVEELGKDIDNLIEMYKMEESEFDMASKAEFLA
ncbi:unnamed protein product [Pieris macdunnoughi]|uniref:Uncharacterized protein n=1 Tax=Pieris macdunnoughi TaxID=345717 RepID=A0A821SFL9_9NEOP|nr:unnamed protein product [Pieris macdunnoughi]